MFYFSLTVLLYIYYIFRGLLYPAQKLEEEDRKATSLSHSHEEIMMNLLYAQA